MNIPVSLCNKMACFLETLLSMTFGQYEKVIT